MTYTEGDYGDYLTEPGEYDDNDGSPEFIQKAMMVGGFSAATVGLGWFIYNLIPETWHGFANTYNDHKNVLALGLSGLGLGLIGASYRDWRREVRGQERSLSGRALLVAGSVSAILGGIVIYDWLDGGNESTTAPFVTTPADQDNIATINTLSNDIIVTEYVNPEDSQCEVYINLNTNQLTPSQQEHVGTHAKYWQEYFYENGGFDQFGATEAEGTGVISSQQQRRFIDGIFKAESNSAAYFVRNQVLGMADATPTMDEDLCRNTLFGDCDLSTPDFSRMPQLRNDYPSGGSQARGC